MKVLFLDIDGVLNSRKYFSRVRTFTIKDQQIDPAAVQLLNQITDKTGAAIVVSSTWRYAYAHNLAGLRDFLSGVGITGKVLGITPIDDNARNQQIQDWLDVAPQRVDSFVVLDDNDLGNHKLDKHLIRTTMQDGLEDWHVQQAIKILG